MRRLLLAVLVGFALTLLSACRTLPPGHDPHGPGNSENAPGHNKACGVGPGNSEDAPGQKKKHCR